MTSLQERLFAMQDKQYAAFQGKLTPGVRVCHKSVTHPFFCVFLYILVES